MLEQPSIPVDKIQTIVSMTFSIQVVEVEFLPIGNDSSAWVYRVKSVDKPYFLKIRKGFPRPATLNVPHYLQQNGITQVVAPITTVNDMLYAVLDDYSLILYPWHDICAWDITLSQAQWVNWGDIMRQIHQIVIPSTIREMVRTEMFIPYWHTMTTKVTTHIQNKTFENLILQKTAEYWRKKQAEIEAIVQHTIDLGQALQKQNLSYVLCHADIHKANLMVDEHKQIQIVDWDEVIIAPKERDLMFFMGNGYEAHKVEAFFEGYGETDISQLALAYYRYEWVVQEFGDNGERIFFNDNLSDVEKQYALDEFKRLFSPDDVIELAYQADENLHE